MIDILHEYGRALLWTDGYRFTGVAMTLWLLVISVVLGGALALLLAVGRVSSNKFIALPIWLFTSLSGYSPIFSAARRSMFSYWCSTPACIPWKW